MGASENHRFGPFATGLFISLALHGVILAVLFLDPPWPERPPEPDDRAIEITLVPPPEPEPEPAGEPVEETAPEEPAPEPEVAEEQAPEAPEPEAEPQAPPGEALPPPPDAIAADRIPIPTLRPVFEFGEADRGAAGASDGGRVDKSEVAEATGPQDAETSAPDEAEPSLTLPEISLPEGGLPENGSGEGEAIGATLADSQSPADAPAETVSPSEPETLARAELLFSPDLTEDQAALAAMGDLPREVRASQLCITELREQLRYGAPPYRPELLPAYELASGNVLAVPDAAFRADGAWYDLSFRCTVDDGALRVTGFALKVGTAIPRAQWRQRGFPEF